MLLPLLLLPMAVLLPPRAWAGEIIGGQEAEPHSRPYMAFVKIETERKGGRMCGGFLIRDDVVVTAAHCNCNFSTITVLLGARNISHHHCVEIDELGRQEIGVHHRISHPEYNDETDENDIMLLQLSCKANLTETVDTRNKVKPGAVCGVAGWGQTSSKINAQSSQTLQEVELTVMSKDICLSQPYLRYDPSVMLCVGDPKERRASFRGDSGGPLVCKGKAQGIVSHGSADGSPPRLFTKVFKYVSWIKKTLRKLKP
ncbi:granzyme B-like [Malaclemys terrapin pileata]|uniref:granzyme B-like n=1 Tax=Malaclemys terrapin pileata TaxID=2991368 RepID=UPI0023A80116|nr:granzyme B-like [Malaclemys terrapin pileata]